MLAWRWDDNIKVMKKRIVIGSIIAMLIVGSGVGIGYGMGRRKVPDNCAKLGVAYLEIGKRDLRIKDYKSSQWQKLIEAQTMMVNECYDKMKNLSVVQDVGEVKSFEDCRKAGYPVMESSPSQCVTPDGRTFAQEVN